MIRVRNSSLAIGVRKPVSPIWIRISESLMTFKSWAVIFKVILTNRVVELLVGEVINLGMS